MLAGAFRALIGRDAAEERLRQRHEAQRAELGAKIGERTRAALAEINTAYRAELDQLREMQRREREAEQDRATGTDGPTVTAPEPERETEEQAEERRRVFIAEVEQERERLKTNDRERGPER